MDRINDGCMDLKRKSSGSRCPYLDKGGQDLFRDKAMTTIQDIEELRITGKHMGACPYYGVRRSVKLSHLVLMPYQSLLSKVITTYMSTDYCSVALIQANRESLGVSVAGNVVIIDEAHNVIETMNDIHSVVVTLNQVQQVVPIFTLSFSMDEHGFRQNHNYQVTTIATKIVFASTTRR